MVRRLPLVSKVGRRREATSDRARRSWDDRRSGGKDGLFSMAFDGSAVLGSPLSKGWKVVESDFGETAPLGWNLGSSSIGEGDSVREAVGPSVKVGRVEMWRFVGRLA